MIPDACKPCPEGGYCPGEQACGCHGESVRAMRAQLAEAKAQVDHVPTLQAEVKRLNEVVQSLLQEEISVDALRRDWADAKALAKHYLGSENIHHHKPAHAIRHIWGRLVEVEAEAERLRAYRDAETVRWAKADCYDHICQHLGVTSNVIGTIAERERRIKKQAVAEWLESMAGTEIDVHREFADQARRLREVVTEAANHLYDKQDMTSVREMAVAALAAHPRKKEGE